MNVEFKVSMRKQTIKNLLIDNLIELDIFGEDALHLKVESANMLHLKQLEMEHEFKMKEMKIRKLEKEKREREMEIQREQNIIRTILSELFYLCNYIFFIL